MQLIADILESDRIIIGRPNVYLNSIAVYPIIGNFRLNIKHDAETCKYEIAETNSDSFIELFSFEKRPIFFRLGSRILKDKEKRAPLHSFILEEMQSLLVPVSKSKRKKLHLLDESTTLDLGGLLQIFKFIDDMSLDDIFLTSFRYENEIGYIANNRDSVIAVEMIFDPRIWRMYRTDALRRLVDMPSNASLNMDDIPSLLSSISNIRKKKISERQIITFGQCSTPDGTLTASLLMYKDKPVHFFARCI